MLTEIYASFHPFIMHFPVAFLVTYVVLELARFKKFANTPAIFHIKAFLVIVGTLGIIDAFFSGLAWSTVVLQTAGEMVPPVFIEILNALFMGTIVTFILFCAIMIAYVVTWMGEYCFLCTIAPKKTHASLAVFKKARQAYARFVLRAPVIIPLAILGFIALTITNAFNSALWFGPNSDPLVSVIINTLFTL